MEHIFEKFCKLNIKQLWSICFIRTRPFSRVKSRPTHQVQAKASREWHWRSSARFQASYRRSNRFLRASNPRQFDWSKGRRKIARKYFPGCCKSGLLKFKNLFNFNFLKADYKMVKYVHFDFHKECSKMRWHRLGLLMDRLREDIHEQSYYLATADGTVLQRQVIFL